MAAEQYAAALEAYDEAAQELPNERAVQLNRGLALLGQDLSEPAMEALIAAADPSAPAELRAGAYYNLGIAHARNGNTASEQEDFEQSSAHFREAADAFKRSLRAKPGNRNAAWNLEYALMRIREEEEKQEQQQEQDQDQEQDQSQEQDQEQDQEQEQDQDQDQEQDQDQDQEQDQEQDQSQEQEQEQDQEQDESGSEPEQEPIPRSEADRFLEALEQNEESLPLQQARRRNAGRRPPEKDW